MLSLAAKITGWIALGFVAAVTVLIVLFGVLGVFVFEGRSAGRQDELPSVPASTTLVPSSTVPEESDSVELDE